ncbi:adhesion G protein-coupled receptor E3, partial [Biomphalaria pfeifferi]
TASLISELNEGFLIDVFAIKETGLYPLDNRTESLVFLVDYKIVAKSALLRDEFETKVIGTFFNTTVHVDYSLNGSLKLQSCYRFKTWEESQVKILEKRFFYRFDNMKIYRHEDQFEDALKITHLLLCPHVRFNRSQYELIYNTSSPAYNITLKINLNTVQLYIKDYNEFSKIGIDENDVLKVCRDLLEIKLSYLYQDLSNSLAYKEIPRPQNILTIACMTASITCLSLTLLTYCMFGELRTEAGVNNMCLSSSVFMAQLSLLAAANA